MATEGSKTARKNQFCQTNVRGKLLKDDPNLADNTFCNATDDVMQVAATQQLATAVFESILRDGIFLELILILKINISKYLKLI